MTTGTDGEPDVSPLDLQSVGLVPRLITYPTSRLWVKPREETCPFYVVKVMTDTNVDNGLPFSRLLVGENTSIDLY